jgi:hypothetical protein
MDAREEGESILRRVRIHSLGVLDPVHVRNHFTRELGGLMVDCTGRWPVRSATRIRKEYCVDARP